ncbi:nitroreductase [Jatrophihabitans sp. GAS493]|uniref:nitroreductase family protein n=1 Tax=Jatrophihabitans sp. GAS493 TaxID=1907575 RepID=UPI000BC0C97C|nr:nitroreductase family protein [Jatrophihabitans sp. GAS493]SOD73068.1 nitroreductase [Jatrophihabitans sp. GAS493]
MASFDRDFERVLRTAFAGREFTDEPVTDADIGAILELARFASSGGNRQGWRVVAIRSPATKTAVIEAANGIVRSYVAQGRLGETAFNTITPTKVTEDDVDAVEEASLSWYRALANAPVLLVVGVDLRLVSSIDASLDRVGIVSGASIYPFVHNIILAAHARGMAGALTTFSAGAEAEVQQLLGFPAEVAIAAAVPLGYPTKRLTKLSRRPVEEFARWERWDGPPIVS